MTAGAPPTSSVIWCVWVWGYKNSVPICRPLYYDYPTLNDAYNVKNQYMFGECLMVCPITAPWDEKGISTREIWLPEGIWTDIFTEEVLRGGYHTVSRDKKSIPVFAKQGAIIPMQNVEGNFCGNPEKLCLHVFDTGDGSYRLYEDDGESTDYSEGKGAFTEFELKGNVFTIYPAEGEHTDLPKQRAYTVYFQTDISGAKGTCQEIKQNNAVQEAYLGIEEV